jgi:hypothetical protein
MQAAQSLTLKLEKMLLLQMSHRYASSAVADAEAQEAVATAAALQAAQSLTLKLKKLLLLLLKRKQRSR